MRYNLILSGTKDTDLLFLAFHPYFNLRKAILDSLEAYAEGNAILIHVPPYVPGTPKLPASKSIRLLINPDKYPNAHALLGRIDEGYRAFSIKTILRNALERPCIDPVLNGVVPETKKVLQPAESIQKPNIPENKEKPVRTEPSRTEKPRPAKKQEEKKKAPEEDKVVPVTTTQVPETKEPEQEARPAEMISETHAPVQPNTDPGTTGGAGDDDMDIFGDGGFIKDY